MLNSIQFEKNRNFLELHVIIKQAWYKASLIEAYSLNKGAYFCTKWYENYIVVTFEDIVLSQLSKVMDVSAATGGGIMLNFTIFFNRDLLGSAIYDLYTECSVCLESQLRCSSTS